MCDIIIRKGTERLLARLLDLVDKGTGGNKSRKCKVCGGNYNKCSCLYKDLHTPVMIRREVLK
jgi:hypothetical protein